MSQPSPRQHATPPLARSVPLALAALFLSGAAGLMDEIAWVRRSSLVFGSTTHALSTVLAVFFFGLALGGWIFGRVSERVRQPLRVCAWIEVALAVLVFATPWAFDAVEGVYARVYRAVPADSAALWAARAGLTALVLLLPTVLMGGTLPLFARQFVRDPKRIGSSVAWLYALNTLGAAAGCLLAGLVLLPALGVRASLALAASLNLLAALLVFSAGAAEVEPATSRTAAPPVERGVRWLVGGLVFLTGFVALGEEVLWARFLAPLVGSTVRTYTITLALVLIGIVAGSFLVARVSDRTRSRALLFGACQAASGLLVLLLMKLPPAWWREVGGELAVASLLLLPPAILAGASFPLAVRMVVANPTWAGIGTGNLIAVNTLGGIAGAVAVGFWLLPHAGLEASLRLLTLASLVAGAGAWMGLERAASRSRRAVLLVTAALVTLAWIAIPALLPARLPADYLADRERLVAYREGFESNLAVVRRTSGDLVLEIDRWWQGQARKTHQIMAAHLPMLLHPDPRRALVVGVGAGQTPERFAMYPLASLDCVDIEPRVFELVRDHFANEWMRDPRVRLLRMDGHNHLTHAAERYDIISLEVGQLFRPGVASFYTQDFYRRARARLAPGGVLSQFVPLAYLSQEELRGVIGTFLSVFPQATLWYNTSELLLIGGADSLPALRAERFAAALADTVIARDLRFSHWDGPDRWLARPAALCGSALLGPEALAALARGGPIYRDDRLVLEYDMARRQTSAAREPETLPLLRSHLAPIESMALGFPAEALERAAAIREENLNDIIAAAYLRGVEPARDRHDYAGAVDLLRQALAANSENLLANRLMGDALWLLREMDESERYYRRALTISEEDPASHAGLGLVCLAERRFAESVEHYRAALALGSDNGEWRNNLGAALGQQGDLSGALEQFERALVLRPDDRDARVNYERTRAALEARRRAEGAGSAGGGQGSGP